MTSLGNSAPLLMGLAFMCLALLLSLFLPVTGQINKPSSSTPKSGSVSEDIDSPRPSTPNEPQIDGQIIIQTMNKSFDTLWQVRGVTPLLIAGFVSILGQQVQILILQYMPVRFNMSLAEANTFNILNSGVNLLMLMIILPLASFLLLRCCGYTTFRKDLVLAHISNFLFIAGALVLSIAPEVSAAVTGITIFGTGIGLSSLLRSLFVELFPPERAVFATTLITTANTIGGSLSGPIYSYAFAFSLDLSGALQGLPFLVSAACFVVVEIMLITMKSKSQM